LKHAEKKCIDPFIISKYFEILREVTNNISPRQIWNLDETSFVWIPAELGLLERQVLLPIDLKE